MDRYTDSDGEKFSIKLSIKNGRYIDDGDVLMYIMKMPEKEWKVSVENNRMILQQIDTNQTKEAMFEKTKIF